MSAEPRQEQFTDTVSGVEFVRVPAGEFRMGSEEDEDARPVHQVRLDGFWVGRCEVTRAQYARFLAATGHPEPAHWKNPRFTQADQPVIGVAYEDAVAFCRWAGGRLPGEAEWEYAARGSDGRRFPWGNEEPDGSRAIFHLDVATGPAAVGTAKNGASPFGALDMAGSVFEWCADWYDADYYAKSPTANPPGPAAGEQRVIRGGSWVSLPDACRATARAKYPPTGRSTLVGFRVARSQPRSQAAAASSVRR
jgi:formylglycine-generating enzyme required for sulfatase activity